MTWWGRMWWSFLIEKKRRFVRTGIDREGDCRMADRRRTSKPGSRLGKFEPIAENVCDEPAFKAMGVPAPAAGAPKMDKPCAGAGTLRQSQTANDHQETGPLKYSAPKAYCGRSTPDCHVDICFGTRKRHGQAEAACPWHPKLMPSKRTFRARSSNRGVTDFEPGCCWFM